MLGTLENPTLDLDPATPSTLDVITATRSGTATYTDANGNIATAAADTVRVDYTQGEELTPTKFQNIENTDFSQWSHTRTSSTENAAISPDGQNNATYVEQNTGETNAGSIYRYDDSVAGVFTLSVYAKKKEKDFIVLSYSTGRTYFNLETGTVGTIAAGNTANIEDAGNGWFRCSITFTISSGSLKAFYVGDTDNSTVVTGGGGIYVYGPQLEEGTTASSFVANTTGSPKFITGATYGPRVPMILVEPSATNLLGYSEDFSNAAWNKNELSLTSGQLSPAGDNTATKLTATGVDPYVYVFANVTADEHTFSFYCKGDTGRTARVLLWYIGSATGTTESIDFTYTDEWQRFEFQTTPTAGGTLVFRIDIPENASEVGDVVYLWGAQLETGSVATSYIPTAGGNAAARTRAADNLVIDGSAFSDFYNAAEGTVYIELTSEDDGKNSYPVYFTQDVAGYAERNNGTWVIQKDGTPNVYLASWANGGFVSSSLISLGSYTAGNLTRVSVSYDSNSYEGSKDGASVQTSTPTTMATTLVDRLFVGGSGIFQNSSRIKRLIYWPYSSDRL
jgi:hypothetical protein